MKQLQKETERELSLIKMGYNSAMQDIFEKIMTSSELKNETRPIDLTTKLIMEQAISKAFMEINETFEDRTLLIYAKYL
jgi:hypothetical protein